MPITTFLIAAGILWFISSIILGIAVFRKRKRTTDIYKAIGFVLLSCAIGSIILAFGIGTKYPAYAEEHHTFSLNAYRPDFVEKADTVRMVNPNLKTITLMTKEGFKYTVTLPETLLLSGKK